MRRQYAFTIHTYEEFPGFVSGGHTAERILILTQIHQLQQDGLINLMAWASTFHSRHYLSAAKIIQAISLIRSELQAYRVRPHAT